MIQQILLLLLFSNLYLAKFFRYFFLHGKIILLRDLKFCWIQIWK